MSLGLEALTSCLQGIIPAMLFTCSKDGTPNAAYLSHVEYVDPRHVALSFQFFNKSRRNVAENPHALVHMLDPDTAQGWAMRLRFDRSEASGPVFERMALRIEAIASYTGQKGIFKLLAADIYEVTSVEPLAADVAINRDLIARRSKPPDAVFTMRALQDMAQRINAADCMEQLLDSMLAGIEEFFGFSHSMILVAGEEPGTFVTIASRGYAETGAGAEARFGEGIIGMVAEAQKPIRISGLVRGILYANAAKRRAEEAGWRAPERQIALPGLQNPESQLGVPLVVRGELVGVLCIESEKPYRFHEDDRRTIELLGSYLAIAIQNMQHESVEAGAAETSGATTSAVAVNSAAVPAKSSATPTGGREIAYHAADEVILVDGEYLIRSLPARILWKLLQIHQTERRAEFTNRELRLDKSLNLPGYKDNLETRLLLLRRRLDVKCPDIRIVPTGRGRFSLDVNGAVRLVARA